MTIVRTARFWAGRRALVARLCVDRSARPRQSTVTCRGRYSADSSGHFVLSREDKVVRNASSYLSVDLGGSLLMQCLRCMTSYPPPLLYPFFSRLIEMLLILQAFFLTCILAKKGRGTCEQHLLWFLRFEMHIVPIVPVPRRLLCCTLVQPRRSFLRTRSPLCVLLLAMGIGCIKPP